MITSNHVRFALRIQKHLLLKIEYIAKFDGRSTNEEIEKMLREWIRAFEESEGEIVILK